MDVMLEVYGQILNTQPVCLVMQLWKVPSVRSLLSKYPCSACRPPVVHVDPCSAWLRYWVETKYNQTPPPTALGGCKVRGHVMLPL